MSDIKPLCFMWCRPSAPSLLLPPPLLPPYSLRIRCSCRRKSACVPSCVSPPKAEVGALWWVGEWGWGEGQDKKGW